MFGLEFIMAGLMNTSTTPSKVDKVAYAPIACVPRIPPKVSVIPSKSQVKYDFSKSRSDLQNFDIDTISPYGPEHKSHVGGLMSGSIQIGRSIGYMHETYKQVGKGCVHLKEIDVKIHIEPTIYIASEYKKGSCLYNEILKHEKKHVREDQLIVNKYAMKIGQALAKVMDDNGPVFGPYKIEELPAIQKNMNETLGTVIDSFNTKMNDERRVRQQAIDSRSEYDQVSERCRGR